MDEQEDRNQMTIETPTSRIERDTIKLNYKDIYIAQSKNKEVVSSKNEYESEVKLQKPAKKRSI